MLAVFRTGMPALNQARAEFGLAPLHGPLDLAAGASRVLVCTSPGYDFGAGAVPGNVRYVGPSSMTRPAAAGTIRGQARPAARWC